MENFIPADGKSIGFIRALQYAVPVPAMEQAAPPPAVENAGEGKYDTAIIIGLLVFVVAGIYFLSNKENEIGSKANQPQAQQSTDKENTNIATINSASTDKDINHQHGVW